MISITSSPDGNSVMSGHVDGSVYMCSLSGQATKVCVSVVECYNVLSYLDVASLDSISLGN